MNKLKRWISLFIFRKQWRKKNQNNFTYAKNKFNINQVTVGKNTYGGISILNDVPTSKLEIGAYCSIAEEVLFILGADHRLNCLSTYPFKYKILKSVAYEAISKGNIVLGDDVWIGHRAIIMSGVQIGQGAVVAAGSVVTKEVPPYAIVAGVPAKVIKYRFGKNIIDKLKTINYAKLTDDRIRELDDVLYESISEKNIDSIIQKIKS